MMAFNPFEGGPKRRAPSIDPTKFNRSIHQPMVEDKSDDPSEAGRTIREQIMWYVDSRPGRTEFTSGELADCVPNCQHPISYLHDLVRSRRLDYHRSSASKATASYCRAGEGVQGHEIEGRTHQVVLAALSRIGVAVTAPKLIRFVAVSLTESQVRNSLATLYRDGKAHRGKHTQGGYLWSIN